MHTSLYDYCVKQGEEALLRQWDEEKNGDLRPEDITYGSKRKVWWRCEKGHSWQASVCSRAGDGAGCPYCTGRRPMPGETDLASQFPDIAAQWHPSKNLPLTPEEMLPGSHRKVWWVCGKGHEWQAIVKSRVSGCGCPVCANRELAPGDNDLAATHPDLAAQWHPVKNGSLTPRQVVAGTRRKVWWRCGKGHEWQAAVSARAMGGAGCPVCAGKKVLPGENDLASQFPEVAAQWNEEKNGALTPDQVSAYSNRRVWWTCERGHAWQASVAARVKNHSGCPYCTGRKVLPGFNDLATVEPQVAAQWHPTLNGALTPEMVTAGSHTIVWWQCPDGHIWKAIIYARAGPQKTGCPVCAGNVKTQRMEWYTAALREHTINHSGSRV